MVESKDKSDAQLKKVKVELWKQSGYLNEIGQPTGMHYAFLSSKDDGYKQCHQWIKCRDFLHDAFRSHITGKTEPIFGFSYKKGTNPPLDLTRMRMMIKKVGGSGLSTRKVMDSALDIIRCVEKSGGIKPLSNLYCASENEDIYIFMGGDDWMESTFMISFYTLLIRLGAKNIEFKDKKELDSKLEALDKKAGDHDFTYLKAVRPFLDKIMKNRKKLKYAGKDGKNFFDSQNIGLFHNYTGIVALCNQANGSMKAMNNKGLEELIAMSKYISDKKDDSERPKQMKKVTAKKGV
jgi:hypothetical protein